MVKSIRSIQLVRSYTDIGQGQGGSREDQEYYANAAASSERNMGRTLSPENSLSSPARSRASGGRLHTPSPNVAPIGLVARGEHGLIGAQEEVGILRRKALVLPTDVADHEQVEAAAKAVEREFAPIDVLVKQRHGNGLRALPRGEATGIQAATEVTYLGAIYGRCRH